MAILHPQEAFLVERYVSIEYIKAMRETWREVIKHLNRCLGEFKKNAPADLRARQLYEQPDIVWGNRVIPNFMDTLGNLNSAVILRKKNDPKAFSRLIAGGGIINGIRGSMEFRDGWLAPSDKLAYDKLMDRADAMASNVSNTINRTWTEGDLTYNYSSNDDPIALPSQIPFYELDHSVAIKIGGKLTKQGIYLPDVSHGAISFLYGRSGGSYESLRGTILSQYRSDGKDHDEFYWKEREWMETNWILVRRVEGKFIDVPPQGFFPKECPEELARWAEEDRQDPVHLVRAGNPCPKSGKWHALAPGSMRSFSQGELMPELELTGFTHTYWYFESE